MEGKDEGEEGERVEDANDGASTVHKNEMPSIQTSLIPFVDVSPIKRHASGYSKPEAEQLRPRSSGEMDPFNYTHVTMGWLQCHLPQPHPRPRRCASVGSPRLVVVVDLGARFLVFGGMKVCHMRLEG